MKRGLGIAAAFLAVLAAYWCLIRSDHTRAQVLIGFCMTGAGGICAALAQLEQIRTGKEVAGAKWLAAVGFGRLRWALSCLRCGRRMTSHGIRRASLIGT
jgi:hypothetical protein